MYAGLRGKGRLNFAKRSFRYQPHFYKCRASSECYLYHRYVLLATSSGSYDLLRECSLTTFLNDVFELSRHLSEGASSFDSAAIIIVHSRYYHYRMYLEILKTMIHHFGNVSLYVDSETRFHEVVRKCDTLENNTCTNLFSLSSLIEQSKSWRAEKAISSTALDLYDSRWLPMNSLTPVLSPKGGELFSAEVQLQTLAMSFCARNRRYNILYEIIPKDFDFV